MCIRYRIYPEDLEVYKIHLKKLKETTEEKSFYLELRLKDENDKYRWVSITEKSFERQANGKVAKIIGTIKDIDDFRQVQMEKEKLNKLQLALKDSNEKLERFAYISSHDLKEPLNTIISALDLMRLEMDSSSASSLIKPIEDSTKRMKSLIEDLLNYSLLSKNPINTQPVVLDDLLVDIKQDMKSMFEQHDALLIVNELPEVSADKTLIKQVFQNLIANAIKYNDKSRPTVTINAIDKPKEHVIFIRDNGIGINKKDYTKIFDVFKTLHNREQYYGTGIGLANCKSIMRAHKGKIWVESVINKGSTFYFSLPKVITESQKN